MEQTKRVIALGFFDGVHIGHGALLRRVAERAEALGAIPAALTFDQHPRDLILGRQVPLINIPRDRAWIMEHQYGIAQLTVLPFDQAMMELPWQEFVTQVLVERFQAAWVVAGHDYRFGHRGEGDALRLSQLCAQLGVGCDIIERVELDGRTVSSTHIRTLLEQGEMEQARRFLGHPHILSGPVVHGNQLGRTIGIPTANLVIPPQVLTPAVGVYATRVALPDGTSRLAVTNVGTRPTVEAHGRVTVEPWILDFSGDLYGQEIRVEFYTRLRGERRFDGLEALREEILRNAQQTRRYFACDTERGVGV